VFSDNAILQTSAKGCFGAVRDIYNFTMKDVTDFSGRRIKYIVWNSFRRLLSQVWFLQRATMLALQALY